MPTVRLRDASEYPGPVQKLFDSSFIAALDRGEQLRGHRSPPRFFCNSLALLTNITR